MFFLGPALGYGGYAHRLDQDVLSAFLARIPEHERALAGYAQDGNVVALAVLEEQLAQVRERRRRSRRSARKSRGSTPG